MSDVLERGTLLYDDGQYHSAFSILMPLAESGNAKAQYLIGTILQLGLADFDSVADEDLDWVYNREIDSDAAQQKFMDELDSAAGWFAKSSRQGFAPATNSLGDLYLQGVGNLSAHDARIQAKELYSLARAQQLASLDHSLRTQLPNNTYREDYGWRIVRESSHSLNFDIAR